MASLISSIRRWFAPPVLPTVEATEAARRVHTVIRFAVIIISIFLVALMALQPETIPQRLQTLVVFNFLVLFLFEFNRRGHTRTAGWGLIIVIGAILTQRTIISGGIHAPATSLFVALVLLAGLLLGERAGIIVGVTAAALLLGIALAEVYGVLPSARIGYTPITLWFYSAMPMALALVIERLVCESLQNALQKTEAELRNRQEAEQRLRLALDSGNIDVWHQDPGAKRITVDERVFELLGIPLTEDRSIPVGTWMEHVHPEDRALVKTELERLWKGAANARAEFRMVRPDGLTRHVLASGSAVIAEDGSVKRLVGVNVDITERKQTERQIRRLNRVYAVLSGINQLIVRERNHQALFDGACRIAVEDGGFRMAWIGMLDAQGKAVLPKAAAGAVDGLWAVAKNEFEDVAGGSGPSTRALRTGLYQVCNDIRTDPLFRLWREPSLQRGYLSSASFPLKAAGKIVGVFTFISSEVDYFDADETRLLDDLAANVGFALELNQQELERRRAEQSLAASEERFRSLIEKSPVAIRLSRTDKTIYANQKFRELYGFQKLEELVGRSTLEQWAPESRHLVEERTRLRQMGLSLPTHYEALAQRKDGSQFPMEVFLATMDLQDGPATLSTIVDITARKRAVEQLEMLKVSIDKHFDAAYWMNTNNQFVYVNDSACKALGYLREELIGKSVYEIAPNATENGVNLVWECLRRDGFYSTESMHRRKDGSEFPVEIVSTYVRFEGMEFNCGFARDITERKKSERQIRRLNRVYAMLSGIDELIVRERNPQALFEEACRIVIERGGFRMAWIGLLDKGTQILRPVAAAGVVDGYLEFLRIDLNDEKRRSGPSGRALLTGQHQVCNDIANDPQMAPWRDEALKRGYRGLATFPLCIASQAIGNFTIFTAEIEFFDSEELRLLAELASDIGFALELHEQDAERRRAEEQVRASHEALRESEKRLRLALDAGQIGVWHQDSSSGAFIADDRLFDLFGIPLTGDRAIPFEIKMARVHPEERTKVVAELGALWAGAPNARAEFRVVRPDGTMRHVVGTGVSVTGDDGKVKRVVGITIDITKRKEAEKERETLVHDLGERVKELGLLHKTARLLQHDHVSISDLLNEWVLLFPAAWQYPDCCQARILYGGIEARTPGWRDSEWKQSVPIKTPDGLGQIDVVYLEPRPLAAEGPFLAEERALLISLTEMLVGYLELRKHQRNLETLVATRTKDLKLAKEEAESANRAKGQFLGNISHEIRTPMNAILGYAQLLENDPTLPEVPRKKAGIIRSSGDHLLQLVNDVLEMSRIESGKVKLVLDPFDLHAMLTEIELMFQPLAANKRNQLAFELLPGLPQGAVGDVGKIRQVIINLLSNAVKFTESGAIRVKAEARAVTTGKFVIMIHVSDSGRGIAAGDLDRIFNAFEQTDSGVRAGGTGLGLTISQTFARMMGGDLTVTSTVGKGSTFSFCFNAGAPPAEWVPSKPLPSDNLRLAGGHIGCKVLIVDDVPTNRDVLADLLIRTGFDVRMAVDGEDGIRVHDAWKPQLVLMDLQMPGMGGMEAIRQLRRNGSRAVLIALTASSLPEARGAVIEAGADEFLLKPYRERDLLGTIGKLLSLEYEAPKTDLKANATDAEKSSTALPLSELLRDIPAELIKKLQEATLEARLDQIEELAAQVGTHSPQAAAQIVHLAQNFQYDELLSTLATAQKK